MATCKYCGEEIEWEYDPNEAYGGRSGYVPIDPGTGERHRCIVSCKFCNEGIVWEGSEGAWLPTDPDTGERHRCKA